MKFKSFLSSLDLDWFRDLMRYASQSRRSKRTTTKTRSRRCFLESLEERVVPANTYMVTIATDLVATVGQPDMTGPKDANGNYLDGNLRYVIAQANEPVNAGSTIVFSNALSGKTIGLIQGELQIAQNTTINGLGAGNLTVSGNNVSRVFNVTSQQAIVSITDLTVTNGNANPANDGIQGNQGGDIFNSGLLLTLTNDVVTNGRAIGGVGGIDARGGGIFNATGASLTLGNTTVTLNTAQGTFSGQGQGGGIYGDTSETVTLLSGTMILNNSALGGPGNPNPSFTGFSPGGTSGANGGNGSAGQLGGAALGGGVYTAGNLTGFDGVQFSNNLAKGGLGATGGTGGMGAPNSNGIGGSGGVGGGGGAGGLAEGGGLYSISTAGISMSNSSFTGNQALGGAGGAGGVGGNAGTGSATMGGTGGDGGVGNIGGDAAGGGVFNSAGDTSVSTSQFTGNQAISGAGGAGGLGGLGNTGPVGGDGGNGGASSFSGAATGGGVFNSAGNLIINTSQFSQNLASSGTGGAGGSGGAAGTGTAGPGGNGGNGNTGNISGVAEGGGAYNSGGNASVSNSSFTGNQAVSGGSGAAGVGGRGGDGTTAGGNGGDGGASSIAGIAEGGAVFNSGGNLTVNNSPFTQNQAVGGAGAVGGLGGDGGNASANPSVGGDGGQGGAGGVGGLAEGGALFNSGLFFTVGSSSFTLDLASSGAGGTGGAGGNAGTGVPFAGRSGDGGIGSTAGIAGGGAIYNQGMDLTVTGSTFTVNEAMSGPGGNGGAGGAAFVPGAGGNAGSSSTAFGGAIAVTAANLFVGSSTFGGTAAGLGNIVLGGMGGAGGNGGSGNGNGNNGGDAYGGGISVSVMAGNVSIGGTAAANILFAGNTVTSGAGGMGANGGNGGLASGGGLSYYLAPGSSTTTTATAISITFTAFNSDTVTSGAGGGATFVAGSATFGSGGGFAVDNEVGKTTVTLSNSTITANQVVGGMGGAAQIDAGGAGGAVSGAGIAFIMGPAGSSGTNDLQITDSHIDNNLGAGGLGGSSIRGNGPGGPGGSGGDAQGGGVYFYNTSNGTSSFTFVDGSASNNQLTGGRGGVGGNAGPAGLNNVPGGPGGVGGQALGGGLFLWTQPQGTNTSTISYAILDTNVLNGGVGGAGGQGAVANGGDGGLAAGGGVYNDGADTTTLGQLNINGTTMAGNIVTAGAGGIAGSGTTPNGGNGGQGGNGGFAMGGGIYNNDATLMVTNTTIGSLPNVFRNILTAGNGGRGGNAGTAGNTLSFADGGNGGNGGNAQGGGVFIAGGAATFLNDTIIDNQVTHTLTTGAGGAPGDAAGNGGTNGMPGADGTANGGGYFAAAGTNSFGNTILDLNSAVTSGPDIDGSNTATITSLGNNILGTGDNAFSPVSTDSMGVNSMSLNLGPLQNNGGPTPTSALLRGSVAIDAGNNALVPSSDSFDQRGTGFPRIFNGTVDVGAFEFEAPSLLSVSPASVPEGSGSVTLTLTGGDFQSGVTTVTVSGSASATWAPTLNLLGNVQSGTQLTINLPANEVEQDGPLSITIEIPDGSGLSGPTHVLTSNSIAFIITTPPVRALNYGPQNNLEGDVVLLGDPSSDPNLNNWQIAAGSLPSGLSINNNTSVISGTIASNAAGTYTVTVSANDDGTTDTGTFTWTVGPLINSLSQTSAVEGSNSFTLTITGADFTVGSSTVHIIGSASAAVPSIALTPLAGSTSTQLMVNVPTSILQQDGPLTINVAVPGHSGTVVSNSETFAITTPPFRAIPYPSVINNKEGDTVSLANPGDPNLINWNITGLPPGLTYNTTTGLISGTIATNGAGTYTVNVSANDDGTTDTATFTWNVALVNQPPTFTVVGNGNETVTLDSGPNSQPYSFPGWATNIGPGAANETNQSVMVNMVSNSNPGLFTSQPIITLNGSGYPLTATLSFTTAPFASGSASITINFQDNGGTANGGHDTSANYTFVIFVTPINQAPSFSDSGNVSATIDNGNNPVPYSIANWATNISPGPSVESWQSVTFNLTNSNPSLFTATGQPTVSPNGTLTFTTVPFATGTATVTATLFDNGGTANGGNDSFAPPPFVINVTPVNQAPTFNAVGNVAVPIDDSGIPQSYNVASWAYNIEPGSPGVTSENGQTVSFVVTNNNPGLFTSNGQPTIVLNGTSPNYPLTGNLLYTLTPLASGTATVTVTLVDNGGTANGGQNTSAIYTFTISVNPGIVSGTADQVWIAQVYRDLLAREINGGQPNEVFYWTSQLDNGTTRLQVGEQVANSDGHYMAYVQSLFQSYLGISADQNALNFYLGLYHQGATDQQVQAEILQSAAYYTKNGGTNFGFLSGLYRDVLGQTLDQTGLSFWGTQLAQGVSRYNVALGIVSSVGAETRVIQASYQKLLGQAADPGSVAYWLGQFAGGMTYEDMLANLVASPQYGILSSAKFYNSTPDVNWLNQVFQDTLGRPIDSTGTGYYILQIRAGARRPDIVASILSSQEYRSDEVATAFQSILRRPADSGSVSYFVNFLNQGFTIEQVKALLFASSEFFNVESGGNNQGFLQALYANVLGAPVDQQGQAIYGGQLAAGETSPNIIMAPNADPVRESVALEVLTSGAAYQELVAAAYLKFLRRPVDNGGLGYWSTLLSQGMTDEAFYGNLLASPEYYARFSA